MALPDFSTKAGLAILASYFTDVVNHLQGAAGKTDAWHLRASAGNNILFTLSDAAGAQKFSIRDSGEVEKFSVDSDGNVTVTALTPSTLTLPTSASPSQTAEGSVAWNSDDDRLTVGTGAATKVIGLSRGAGLAASATQELAYDTTAAALKVWDGSASRPLNPVVNYKSATQVLTTTTSFADVAGAGAATFAFAIGASEVWEAEYYIPLAFGGTGGVKFQLTGPSAPTNVDIRGARAIYLSVDGANELNFPVVTPITAVTAFSSSIGAANSKATGTGIDGSYSTANGSVVHIRARIINGSNAGTVTLQVAQNFSNSTTTLGLSSFMRAERIA